jgi:hypothetical protein
LFLEGFQGYGKSESQVRTWPLKYGAKAWQLLNILQWFLADYQDLTLRRDNLPFGNIEQRNEYSRFTRG